MLALPRCDPPRIGAEGRADRTIIADVLREVQMTNIEVVPALGHFDSVRVAFSPDGRHVLTGCHWTVKLWERATGRLIRTFCHDGPVLCFALSPDGGLLITGSGDVRMWNIATGVLVHTFRDQVGWCRYI